MKTPFVFQTVVWSCFQQLWMSRWVFGACFSNEQHELWRFCHAFRDVIFWKYDHVDSAWCMFIEITTRKNDNHIELLIVFFEIDG